MRRMWWLFRTRRVRAAASAWFDPVWYVAEHADVAAAGVDPLEHYLRSGRAEGRQPCAWFDPVWYVAEHADVAAAGVDPLEHYLRSGRAEGFAPSRDHIPDSWRERLFDAGWYLEEYPDVAAAGVDALEHWFAFGRVEGRLPFGWFDAGWYLEEYPDVAAAGVDALEHWFAFGRVEGRLPSADHLLGAWRERFDGMTVTPIEEPEVSIIVLNFDRSELTLECVESILHHTDLTEAEVIVVDNGSSETQLRHLLALPEGVSLLRVGVNRYFGEGNNIGAEHSRGRLLCFMNNDVLVTPGWLEALLDAYHSDDRVRACGPLFVYPDGVIQEAGASVDTDGRAVQHGKGQEELGARYSSRRPVDYVSAATLLIDADAFAECGGFHHMYEPAYYEDTHLCRALRGRGYLVMFAPDAVVIHQESATTARGRHDLKLDDIVELNRAKYLASAGQDASYPPLQRQLTRQVGAEPSLDRTVVFTPYPLTPGGGESYILSVAEAAARCGHEAVLWTPHRYSRVRVEQVRSELGLDSTPVELWHGERPPPRTSTLVVMANEVIPPLAGLGDRSIYHCQFPFDLPRGGLAARWGNLDSYSDVVVNSNFTRAEYGVALQRLRSPGPPVHVINPPCADFTTGSKRPLIVSVGRFSPEGHTKNQHVLIAAFKELVQLVGPLDLELILIGSLGPRRADRDYFNTCREDAAGFNIRMLANAPKRVLAEALAAASIYWHAAGSGASPRQPWRQEHFGMSVVEAMSAGAVPLAFRGGGPREIIEDATSGYLWHDQVELVELSARLLSDPLLMNGMSGAARERAAAFGRDRFMQKWMSLLAT